jgi:hypothetical protein
VSLFFKRRRWSFEGDIPAVRLDIEAASTGDIRPAGSIHADVLGWIEADD